MFSRKRHQSSVIASASCWQLFSFVFSNITNSFCTKGYLRKTHSAALLLITYC